MNPMRSLYYIGPQIGHMIVYCTGWVLDRTSRTKETPIFVKLWIPVNGTQRCDIELHDIHKLDG